MRKNEQLESDINKQHKTEQYDITHPGGVPRIGFVYHLRRSKCTNVKL